MNNFNQNMAGMGGMTDQVVATDLLVSAKTGIKNYASALSETYTPQLRDALQNQLNDVIALHQQITDYMVSKGYYHPVNVQEQIQVDMQAAQTAMNLPQQQQQ